MHAASFTWTVVTGASSGIGAAVARRLAGERHALVLVGRDRERLEAVGDDCRALGASEVCLLLADLRDRPRIAEAFGGVLREGPIGLFVGAAGILDGRRDGEVVETAAIARTVLEVDLLAAINAVHLVLPGMIERGEGGILLVASLAALAPLPDAPAYSAAKAGLLAYGVALGEAVRAHGIRVSVSCPGHVRTGMSPHHVGPHPGAIGADRAAERILRAFARGRAIDAFPFALSWLARLALLAPAFVRRRAMAGLRFHINPDPPAQTDRYVG